MKRVVNIFSPGWEEQDSYGREAIELAEYLQVQGWYVNRLSFPGVVVPGQKPIRPAWGGFLMGYPTNFYKYGVLATRGVRIGCTHWESDVLPAGWADELNTCDAVSVGSQFTRDVLVEGGVTSTVLVHPLGITEEYLYPKRRVVTDELPFTFITIGDRNFRKNWHLVADAFVHAFGTDMRYKLIIKSRHNRVRFSNPNIEVIAEDLSNDEMALLYRRAHVMVFPSSGEGFGFPPREFAATGGIAMTTDWSGTADDLPHWGVAVPPAGLKPAWDWELDKDKFPGRWAAIDWLALSEQMKFVAAHFESYADFGIRAAGYVQSKYRWSRFGHDLLSLYEEKLEERYGNQRGNTQLAV